jgi:hypothetical protein
MPLEPRRNVHAGPHGHSLAILKGRKVYERFPGLYADPHGNGVVARSWQARACISDTQSTSDIVDVCDRSAEEDEDLVTDVLLNRAALSGRNRADLTEAVG